MLVLYEPCRDSNKSRWEILDKWTDFIGDVAEIEFERPESRNSDILKTKRYFEVNYAKFLNKLFLTTDKDYFFDWLKQLMDNRKFKIDNKDFIEVNELRLKLGMKKLTMDEMLDKIEYLAQTINNIDKYKI